MGYIKDENSLAITINSNLVNPQTMQEVPTKTVCWIDTNNYDPRYMNIVTCCQPLCAQTFCEGYNEAT